MLATRPHTEDASRVAETGTGRGSKLGSVEGYTRNNGME